MDKLSINAIIGLNIGEMYGKYKVYLKTTENLVERVDFNEISYSIPERNFPCYEWIHKCFIYPGIVKKSLAKNADLTHIFSQEETYLLNRLKFDIPTVATCLDIIPLIYKENSGMSLNLVKYNLRGMKKADKIITISEHTKKDLIKYLKISPEKIETILLGVDPTFQVLPEKKINEIRKKYKLPEKFILYLGSEQPRKNFQTLLKSFKDLIKNSDLKDIKLLKVGSSQISEIERNKIYNLIESLGIKDEVIFKGYVLESDLSSIYNAADLLVYPSLYEGFGLPPLEGMASGTPVITSNTSSLPEVVGDAGIMVDPMDVNALTESIYQVLTDTDLKNKMIRKGLERSKMFTWEKTAQKTFNIYENLLNDD
jgi:glycosyltransferase involved in cell wall biosynthesis